MTKKIMTIYTGVCAIIFSISMIALLICVGSFLSRDPVFLKHTGTYLGLVPGILITFTVVYRSVKMGIDMVKAPEGYQYLSTWKRIHPLVGYTIANIMIIALCFAVIKH